MRMYFSLLVVFFVTGMLTACVPVCCGPEPSPKPSSKSDDKVNTLSDVAGLWNSSTKSSEGEDVIFTRITRNGDIIEYDFDGDNIDKGLDCYTVETGSIRHRNNQYYTVLADMHDNVAFVISLELIENSQAMNVHYVEPIHKKNSDTFQPYSEIWQRVLDDSFLNNEPSCQKIK